ncbi:hypothetical protein ACWDYJ_29270 [Streptomyces sp. NPDC003042]
MAGGPGSCQEAGGEEDGRPQVPQRLSAGLGKHQMVPGWPYSIVAALETGRTSWTALLDAIRLEEGNAEPEAARAANRELTRALNRNGAAHR